ncbi:MULTISPECIES: ATP-dependent DNA helicase [Bacillota]|uniref:ATP-dependent DNA helicase n=1 Tax=Bacillota TaxID=1239 RepID=UPI0039EE8C3D
MPEATENLEVLLKSQLDKVFEKGGVLEGYFDGYEPRPSQIKMAKTIIDALVLDKHALIEAGTGTGKSLGYAIAAALYSIFEKKTIILSTHTITLQNQLIDKDLPLVQRVIKDLTGEEIKYALAKGRGHYLCTRRLVDYLSDGLEKEKPHLEEAQLVAKQLGNMRTGDRSESLTDIPYELWQEIRGESDDCLGSDSPFYNGCFIQEARRKLKESQIIVCNHALFFTDLNLRQKGLSGILPEYDAVVFDEGHRIEDVFSNFYQKNISLKVVSNLFDRFLDRKSKWMKEEIEPSDENEEVITIPETFIERVQEYKQKILSDLLLIFAAVSKEMKRHKKHQYLLTNSIIKSNKKIDYAFNEYIKELKTLRISENWDRQINRGLETYIESVITIKKDISHLLLNKDSDKWANWVTYKARKDDPEEEDDLSLAAKIKFTGSPIESNTVLENTLFKDVTSIIASATLTTAGNFDFISKRLGIGNDYIGVQIDSPFNYKEQALLIIPENAPNPKPKRRLNGTMPRKDPYKTYITETCKQILEFTKGRTFILFTSYRHLQETFNELQPWCEENGIIPIQQTSGTDREQMIRDFKTEEKAVLFGAESFWEGVDIPGDDLVCVVIVKIPFPVPSEPIAEARMEKLKREGSDPFYNYSLPMAILKIMQGFGRLIRRVTDKGAVIILDSRTINSKYGSKIIDSLPDVPLSYEIKDIQKMIKKGD